MDKSTLSKQIITRGHLSINLPVFVLVVSIVMLVSLFNLPWILGVLGGSLIGYITWGKLVKKWVDWALRLGISQSELIKIAREGKVSMFSREIFEKIVNNDKK